MSNYKKWKEYGNKVKEVERLMNELYKVPDYVTIKQMKDLKVALNNISNFKSEMEDYMLNKEDLFITRDNEQYYLKIFYGSED